MGRVAVLLTEGFADWEAAYILGVGRPFYGLDVEIVSVSGDPIRSQGGLQVTADGTLGSVSADAFDILVLCGGTGWVRPDAPDIGPSVRAFLTAGKTVAAICGGTLALARAEALEGRRHTSNDRAFLADNAPGYVGRDLYAESRTAVVDGPLITAPGTSPATFTAAVFRAAGLEETKVAEFLSMLAAEHRPADGGH